MGRREKPIDPGAGPVQRFAFELRKLRQEAGSPTYREMAQGATYSIAALARAAAGESVPSLPLTLAYVKACGGNLQEWERRWHAVRDEEAAQPRAMAVEAADPPYRGLARFEPGDHAWFFGRSRLTDNLAALAHACRCVTVLGPSGSGKSSLLRAGLIPRLQNIQGPALRPAAIRIFTPGPQPVHDHQKLFTPAEGPGDTWLVVDQFEETFTLCNDPGQQREFVSLVLSAREPGSRLRVVLGVRADFYARCLEYEGLAKVLGEASLPVGPMTPDELRDVIVKPAAAEGLIVERALTARLIKETRDAPGGLPLLSHTLLETWRRRCGRTLTLDGYEAAGGIHGAISQTAEDLYTRLTPPQAETARRILLRLITPGEGAPDTRRPIERAELATTHRAAPDSDPVAVLQRLARARLVTLDDANAELAHEALITAWPRLRRWIEEDRDTLRTLRRLTEAARAWSDLDQDPGALYRGTRLATAEEAFATSDASKDLTTLERDFLTASTTAHDHERRAAARITRRMRRFTGTLAVLLVLALTAGLIAWNQYRTSEQQRHKAVTAQQAAQSRELAARAVQLSGQRPEAAMILALKAYRKAPTTEARGSLLSAYAHFYANQFTGHSKLVASTAFSADGRILATASMDRSVKLWDARSHRLVATLTGHTDFVNTVAFSPDGHTLASAGNDRSVKLWDARSHRLLATLTGHTNTVEGLTFSPDGQMLASAGSDRTVRLWDVRTHRERAVLTGHTEGVLRLAFSPDGRTLASAGMGRTTRLWDVSSHKTLAVLAGRAGAVNAVAFSPDGRTLATAGNDRSVKLWDVRSRRLLAALTGHTHDVQEVAFSPDGRMLASGSIDGTVRLWRPRARKALATLNVKGPVYGVAFSPDSRTLASTGNDSTVRLWDPASRRPLATLTGRTGTIASQAPFADRRAFLTVDYDNLMARWSTAMPRTRAAPVRPPEPVTASVTGRDGHVLATADRDDVIRVYNLATGQRTATLPAATTTVRELAITPDGSTLAVAGDDNTLRVWDVAARRTTAVLRAAGTVTGLALRPDGRALASVSTDGTTRLWPTRSGHPGTLLPGPKDATRILAFSPDGRTLAVGNTDNSVRLWDVATRRAAATLTANSGLVRAVAFSPDGSTLATTTFNDGSLRLWSTRTARLRAALTSTMVGTTVRFSPHGDALATFGPRDAAQVWSTNAEYVATRICRISTEHHWARLLPDQPVKDLCPP
ncbi:nSTAND1 domain-containing NTPase [Streptomyces sp. NPDC003032]